MYETTPHGVCIALAYTSNGGTALYIETMKINQTKKKSGNKASAHIVIILYYTSIQFIKQHFKRLLLNNYQLLLYFNCLDITPKN